MKIAIDAMGGDYAPADVVKGAVIGARNYNVGLFWSASRIKSKPNWLNWILPVSISKLSIPMNSWWKESSRLMPCGVKRQASIALATRLVKEGQASRF